MIIRAPRPAESARIAELLRAAFQPYLPITQIGASEFLRVYFERPESSPERVRYVWADNNTVLAYADFRMISAGCGFLSYICVDERAKGQGIATALINQFICEYSPSSLSLDVDEDNEAARALYKKLGFEQMKRSRWLTRTIPQGEHSMGPLQFRNLHVSHACFVQYGFCEIETTWAGQPLCFGRIGTGRLLVPTLDTFRDDAFLASARKSFPSLDEALYHEDSSESVDDPNTHVLCEENRFTLQISSNPGSESSPIHS